MREQLTDIMRQVVPLFKKIKITGTPALTKVEAFDEEKILFLVGSTKQPVPEFLGEFGIGSLSLLAGLLDFPSYKSEDAQITVHRNEVADYLSEFEFREKRGGYTHFKTMNPRLVDQADVKDIPWSITVAPTRATIAELTKLASHLSEVDTSFGVRLEKQTLFVTIGAGASGTHTSSVVFATDVDADFNPPSVTYNTKHLLAILKNTGSDPNASVVRFSEKGVAGITVETEHAIYNYYLRAKPV